MIRQRDALGRFNSVHTPVFEWIFRNLRVGSGCWEWAGAKSKLGYGKVNLPSGSVFAHRVLYEFVNGPIPDGLEIDHLCHNRACVRPDHLEAVTHAENIRRSAVYKQWTHCAKGHRLAGENLSPTSNGFRCRTCKRESANRRTRELVRSGRCACGDAAEPGYKSCAGCKTKALQCYYAKNGPCPKKEAA